MARHTLLLFFSMLFLLTLGDTVLANKFTTIGGGVSGASHEKLDILKKIGAYSGLLFLFLGLMGILTRRRYEGFIGQSKKGKKVSSGVYALLILGSLLSLLFLV
mgnify:FL=1